MKKQPPTPPTTNKHAPLETQWATFEEYLRQHGVDLEAIDASMKAFARKRIRRLRRQVGTSPSRKSHNHE